MAINQIYYDWQPKLSQFIKFILVISAIITIYNFFHNVSVLNINPVCVLTLFIILLGLNFLISKRGYVVTSWIGAGNRDKVDIVSVYDPVQNAPRGRIPFFKLNNKIVLVMKWNHIIGGWWSACIAINPYVSGAWCPDDLCKYKYLEFNIKGSGIEDVDTKLNVRLEDSAPNKRTETGAHNSTNWIEISAGPNWLPDLNPIRIPLDNFDWTIEAFPYNRAEPNRKNILQITFGCDSKMEDSKEWKTAMVKDIGFVRDDGTKKFIDIHVKISKIEWRRF